MKKETITFEEAKEIARKLLEEKVHSHLKNSWEETIAILYEACGKNEKEFISTVNAVLTHIKKRIVPSLNLLNIAYDIVTTDATDFMLKECSTIGNSLYDFVLGSWETCSPNFPLTAEKVLNILKKEYGKITEKMLEEVKTLIREENKNPHIKAFFKMIGLDIHKLEKLLEKEIGIEK